MKTSLVQLVIVFLMASCVSMQEPTKIEDLANNIENTSIPGIGIETTVRVGEMLLEQGATETVDGIEVFSDDPSGYVSKGIYRFIGMKGEARLYEPVWESGARINIMTLGQGNNLLIDYGDSLQLANFTSSGALLKHYATLDPSTINYGTFSIYQPSPFQQTLIYLGRSGNRVAFSYREYERGYARPAFVIDVSYDIDESNIILFKDAEIEIVSSTSSTVTYKVLNNFNTGELGDTYIDPIVSPELPAMDPVI